MTTSTDGSLPHTATEAHIELTEAYAAHNYHPLRVVLESGEGAWVTDVEGRRYLDCLAGYSALNFGHSHPRLVKRAQEQLGRLTLTSRAFYHDQLGPFARDLARLTGKEMILPMNSGAEAVETAIKVARKWGYLVKGVPENQATIVAMEGNFHGRTTTIVSFSTDPVATAHYAPYTPGFRLVPYGDIAALEAAIDDSTVAVLLEPIQGEGGVVIPPDGYLQQVRTLCNATRVLMMADEIQSGLARTGRTFACDHEQVVPDVYILGKALGGGVLPVSAITADGDVLEVITPGSHGSTFGGNPLAAAIGREVVAMLNTGEFQERAETLGRRLADGLGGLVGHGVTEVRARGLWAGVDIDPELSTGRDVCERLLDHGVLAKEAHGQTVRLAPPLVASEDDVDLLVEAFRQVCSG
ncbi:ornithine--oxo-acid transaminase [Nocardioides pocheonensis]|uniref:ornithine aminotransferase n=1 Tax=Nocardioides pocheonensis TaxID=661485 RepID=A0A3N0GYY9_9ACTN|nr:ornithine--oxo-acid transaminase [Nocardioides pocheonensis]RNM17318.1 ornithine--oxo-acid transaminase [Nocardioides pocheonensis]